jgi:hypothetical protein
MAVSVCVKCSRQFEHAVRFRQFCDPCRRLRNNETARERRRRAKLGHSATYTCRSCKAEFQLPPGGRWRLYCDQCRYRTDIQSKRDRWAAQSSERRCPRCEGPIERDRRRQFCAACVRAKADVSRKYRYNLTPDEFDAMLQRQRNVCAVCGRDGGPRGLVVDHCHRSGQVRGLLCNGCNTGLGHFGEDPQRLIGALAYLGVEFLPSGGLAWWAKSSA